MAIVPEPGMPGVFRDTETGEMSRLTPVSYPDEVRGLRTGALHNLHRMAQMLRSMSDQEPNEATAAALERVKVCADILGDDSWPDGCGK